MKLYILISLLIILLVEDEVVGWRRRRRRRGCHRVSCVVNNWLSWGACSQQCGSTGTQTRIRTKRVVERCITCPYSLRETRACNRNRCQNGGTSIPGRCKCTPRWTGTCCEIDLRGPKGEKGQRGFQGQKGSRGSPGQKGLRGPPGPKGNAGRKGDRGQKGSRGLPGQNGLRGRPGQRGSQGRPGRKGSQGRRGPKGSSGISKCRRVTRSGRLVSCRFGERVFGCYSIRRGCRGAGQPTPSLRTCRNWRRCGTTTITMAICCKTK